MHSEGFSPMPPSERGQWLLAFGLFLLGVGVLAVVLTGVLGRESYAASGAPPAVLATATPVSGAAAAASALAGANGGRTLPTGELRTGRDKTHRRHRHRAVIMEQAESARQGKGGTRVVDQTETEIPTRWMEGFYPIYATAQSTFGVNWLLLASIHMQETAFSTAPSTYHGLNFADCCGGPMQFNVTNGPVSTWDLVSDSYIYGKRPPAYDHMTARHPSIYDDFDAIMAAAHLLSVDGAGYALDGSAWGAAYDYYGHDAAGVTYADEVIARAIGWSQHGFCINCGMESALVEAVHAAYGAPVLATYATAVTAARVTRLR